MCERVLQILSAYTEDGYRPSRTFAGNTHPLHRMIVSSLEGLPEEPCQRRRQRHVKEVLLQIRALMVTLDEPIVQEAIPLFMRLHDELEESLAFYGEIFITMCVDLIKVLKVYIQRGSGSFDEIVSVLEEFLEYGSLAMRPVLQALATTLKALPNSDCKLCRTEQVQKELRQIVVLMRPNEELKVREAIPLFEQFLSELEKA